MSELDRISNFPDEILCHILSFLPTKVACTTSVLSKRWTLLCYSLKSLHFEDDECVPPSTVAEAQAQARVQAQACLQFHRLVDKFMLSQHHHIKSFRLTCRSGVWGEDFAPLKAVEWVEAAKRRCVEDFQICVQDLIISPEQRRNQDLLLSYGLRSLSALFLKLKYTYYNSEISVVRSPKTGWAIRLRLVENLRLPPSIFTCKTLVVLKLSGLLVDIVSSVDLPLLKTLHLMEVFFKKRKDLMLLLSGCPLLEDLNAPTVCHLQNDCILGFRNLPNLVKANLRALHVPFTILYNARFLRLDWTDYFFNPKPWFSQNPNRDYYTAFPVFQNLIHIELCPLSGEEVLKLLHHCPKLQNLVLEKHVGNGLSHGWPAHVPECISLHLRTCSIVDHTETMGNTGDLLFAAYVMKKARLLQIMTIHHFKYRDPEQKHGDLLKLEEMCPSLFPTCKISLTSLLV